MPIKTVAIIRNRRHFFVTDKDKFLLPFICILINKFYKPLRFCMYIKISNSKDLLRNE